MASPDENALTTRLYELATGDEDARLCRDIPDSQCAEQPANFVLHTCSLACSKIGDGLADTKVVLPWLLGLLGAPGFMVGLLVPIRESLALLPQLVVGGVIRRFARRKWFWVAGSGVEGLCILGMAGVAALGLEGGAAGWTVIGLLVVFSLARGVASVASKDVLGKTVSKGRRGRVNGYATSTAGLVAGGVGIYLALSPAAARPDWALYVIIGAAGLAWLIGAATFAAIAEEAGAVEGGQDFTDLLGEQWGLLARDRQLQLFLAARALMISTALAGPIYVSLAQARAGQSLDGLGLLVVATGLAGAVSASVWGRLADRSSRLTMALAAAGAGVLAAAVVAVDGLVPDLAETVYFYGVVLFVLGIAHAGVRIGRKTHIVDIAGGDNKATYVALSNTVIGIILLALGGLVSLVVGWSPIAGLGLLAALAIAGAATALLLDEAQA